MNQRIPLFLSILIFVQFLIQTSILAQQNNTDITISIYRILHSKILNEDRTLLISLPRKGN